MADAITSYYKLVITDKDLLFGMFLAMVATCLAVWVTRYEQRNRRQGPK